MTNQTTARTGRTAINAGQTSTPKRSASTATTASEASSTSSESALPGPQGMTASAGDENSKRSGGEQVLQSDSTASSTIAPAPSAMSLLALDRKAMEAERLARRQRQLDTQKAASDGGGVAHEQQQQRQSTESPHESLRQSWKVQPSQEPFQQASQHLAPPTTQNRPTKRKAEGDIIVIDDDDDEDKDGVAAIRGSASGTASDHFGPPLARRRKIDDHGSKPEHIVLNKSSKIDKGKDISLGRTLSSWAPPASTSSLTSASASLATPSSTLPYAKGVVKKTWARGQPRRGDDITIDEIWQKDQLELAILSSFQWDDEWMMSHLNLAKTRLLLIAFAADDKQVSSMGRWGTRKVLMHRGRKGRHARVGGEGRRSGLTESSFLNS